MSDAEQKLFDGQGEYLYAVRSGQPDEGAEWQSCRIVLTDRRLMLATNGSNRTVPLSKVELVEDLPSIDALEHASDVTGFQIGSNVVCVSVPDGDLAVDFCRATLHDQVILVKHPAVEGGVVQDADWEKAKFRYVDGTVKMALSEGRLAIDVDDVGSIETTHTTVRGDERTVVAVEHTEGDISVETHLTGTERHSTALDSLFSAAVERNGGDADELGEMESQVLMALYSGVSPFEMSDFVGISPDEVEEIYQHLLEVGAVDEVRTRTEVSLNARGRNLASDAMNSE